VEEIEEDNVEVAEAEQDDVEGDEIVPLPLLLLLSFLHTFVFIFIVVSVVSAVAPFNSEGNDKGDIKFVCWCCCCSFIL